MAMAASAATGVAAEAAAAAEAKEAPSDFVATTGTSSSFDETKLVDWEPPPAAQNTWLGRLERDHSSMTAMAAYVHKRGLWQHINAAVCYSITPTVYVGSMSRGAV